MGKNKSILVVLLVLFFGYIWIIQSTTLLMIHNAPVNLLGEPLSNHSQGTLPPEYPPYGLTVGNESKPLPEQFQMILPPFFLVSIAYCSGITAILLSIFTISFHFESQLIDRASLNEHLPIQLGFFKTLGIAGVLYLLLTASLLSFFDSIVYLKKGTGSIPVSFVFLIQGLVGGPPNSSFYSILLFQTITVASVIAVWSRRLVPDRDIVGRTKKRRALELHKENWRNFGNWIVSIYGVVGLSSALIFITEVTDFGGIYVRHVATLIGGALVLNLIYVIIKVKVLEEEITDTLY